MYYYIQICYLTHNDSIFEKLPFQNDTRRKLLPKNVMYQIRKGLFLAVDCDIY